MTNWDKLQSLVEVINQDGVDINFLGSAKEIGSPFPVNGCAFMEEEMIDLFADDPRRDADKLSAALIHEYGHILSWRKNKDDGEKVAWEMGVAGVPKWMVPPCLPKMKKTCLEWYENNND